MILTPSNRIHNGLVTQVFDPETGIPFPATAKIDLSIYPFEKQQYFLRVLADGDVTEVLEGNPNNIPDIMVNGVPTKPKTIKDKE